VQVSLPVAISERQRSVRGYRIDAREATVFKYPAKHYWPPWIRRRDIQLGILVKMGW
jgi:hypothetical protein